MTRRGCFISFEGIDGSGKTTLIERLSRLLSERNIEHIVAREPGGTRLGGILRNILLDPEMRELSPWVEMLLYTASRAQQVTEVVRPALASGRWVLADRFIDATLAYQGYGQGIELEKIRALHNWVTDRLWPDCTVLLDCDPVCAQKRLSTKKGELDRFERFEAAFKQKVRQGYLKLAESEPERFIIVDASLDPEAVFSRVHKMLSIRYQELV